MPRFGPGANFTGDHGWQERFQLTHTPAEKIYPVMEPVNLHEIEKDNILYRRTSAGRQRAIRRSSVRGTSKTRKASERRRKQCRMIYKVIFFQKEWDKIEDVKTYPHYLRNIVVLEAEDFVEKVINANQKQAQELVKSIYSGDVYLLKMLSQEKLLKG